MANDVKIRIRAMEAYKRVINDAAQSLRGLRAVAGRVTRFTTRALKRMAMVGGVAIGGLGLAIKKAFDFELYRNQFAVLLGSMDKAKQRFEAIKALSSETPFQLEELIKASKLLQAFGFEGEKNVQTLKEVGDAAAAMDPSKLEEIAFWFGRLAVGAQAGQTGEATNRLLELALISGKAKQEIDGLAKAGANQEAIMARARMEILRFKGGMDTLKTTGHGLFSTLKDNWTLALATFGEAFKVQAKDAITGMINKLQELREDGTIERWASKASDALVDLKELFDAIMEGGESRTLAIEGLQRMGRDFGESVATKISSFLKEHADSIGGAIARGMIKGIVKEPYKASERAVTGVKADIRTGMQAASWVAREERATGIKLAGEARMQRMAEFSQMLRDATKGGSNVGANGPIEVKIVNPEDLTAQ